MTSDYPDQFTSHIMDLMAKNKVLGLSICVVKDNETIYQRGFGYRNANKLLPMTEHTLTGIGSVSKSFTATAILQLQEKGLLNIEDPIVKYFPWFPQNPEHPIKIKHMLSHSTGIPALDGTAIEYLHHEKRHIDFTPITTRSDLEWYIKHAGKERLHNPGERFFYNNDMYALLSFLTEDLTGMKFPEYMKENIFKPLDMNRTTYSPEDIENDPLHDASTGYALKDKKLQPIENFFSIFHYGGGGILSCVQEMAHYIRFILGKGAYKDRVLLKEATANLLWEPLIASPYTYQKKGGYCLGWGKEERYGTTLIRHGGGLFTSTTNLAILPEKNIGVFVIENDMKGICSVVVDVILSILNGYDPSGLSYFKYQDIVSKITGTYKTYRGLYSLEVKQKGPILNAHLEIDDGEFYYPIYIKDAEKLICAIPTGLPDEQKTIEFLVENQTGKVSHAIYDRYQYARQD
jgi:CubicO group peptidase (beta-lactamase class C family)